MHINNNSKNLIETYQSSGSSLRNLRFHTYEKKILKDDNLIVISKWERNYMKRAQCMTFSELHKSKRNFSLLRLFYSLSLPSNYDTNNHLLHNFAKNGTTLKDLRNLQKIKTRLNDNLVTNGWIVVFYLKFYQHFACMLCMRIGSKNFHITERQ